MDIRVLGSGSSGNAYMISDGKTTLLVECGLPWKALQQALQYRVTSLDACLLTHEHMDHAKSAQHLADYGMKVYMSEGTKRALNAQEHNFRTFFTQATCRYLSVAIGSFLVSPFHTIHDATEPVGFLIQSKKTGEKLVFITDSAYCPYRFTGIDYWMIEVNYVKSSLDANTMSGSVNLSRRQRTVQSHMSLETAVEMLRSSNASMAKAIYCMHLSDKNSDEEVIKRVMVESFGVPVVIC
uniref:MBL fold metallo-hydrolase n=1 Tax=Ndongobacter massiliensis TaxID=1871025 RepID=UPI0009F80C6D|nr:MBL fold metallo-hydrolase [Ndongobacter massiliensis]